MPETLLAGTYDYRLVALSVLIAILASFAALDLGGRVTACRSWTRIAWLGGGGVAMGIGICSTHYVGMLAFHLPIPIQYDWPTTAVSLLTGIFAAFVALYVISGPGMGLPRTLAGSALMGGAISAMHFIAMAAMRLRAMCHYSPALVALSILIAIAGSWIALWITFVFRHEQPGRWHRKAAGALLMGAAIASMHYSAMAAASFTSSGQPPDLSHAVSVSALGIAGLSGVPAMVLVLALFTCLIDRLAEQRKFLDELFEQAPTAIALTDGKEHLLRINRAFKQLFGFTSKEARGRRLRDLIVPAEYADQAERLVEMVSRGVRVQEEVVRRRKDGTRLVAEAILVPFVAPRGGAAVYAMYRDITGSKRTEDALRNLSGQLLQLQDEERRRLARELHDSTGQKLSALAMNLAVVGQSTAALDARSSRALSESVALTDESLRELRTLSYLLHPPELDELGLPGAVRHFVAGFEERSGIPVHLELSPDFGRLPAEVETALFRVLQESLNNVHRHSNSVQVRVALFRSPGSVTLRVEDTGPVSQAESQRIGSQKAGRWTANGTTPATPEVGLAGMRERVVQLGGRLKIQSSETGTILEAVLPTLERGPKHRHD